MSMQSAIGVYIAILRNGIGMTQQELAIAVGATSTTISRYETGSQEHPDMSLIMRVIDAVRGRGDDIQKLVTADNPSDDYARALAREAQLTSKDRESIGLFAGSDEDTLALIEAARQLGMRDKSAMRELLGYANALLSRAGKPPIEPPPATSRRRRRVSNNGSK